jgi:HKD family nuclease
MNIKTYLHSDVNSPTTLSEIKRVNEWVRPSTFFGVYAYATHSGASAFELQLGGNFWSATPSKWLFGIDYGRTQPQALKFMCSKANTEVRVVDGAWQVNQKGFLPRRDFHAKMSITLNESTSRFGMIVGSGNFSSSGLRKNIEAGVALQTDEREIYRNTIEPTFELTKALWDNATPAYEILDDYEERWSNSFQRSQQPEYEEKVDASGDVFWIEAGYVTKNRGLDKPGNQIDLPRGMANNFGFSPPDDLDANSTIGEVTFETPTGDLVSRNLRLGNNMMEKITLPIPEAHGFDIYDGKILVFQKTGDKFLMRALEGDDFETAFGDRLFNVKAMGSGRRYGFIS